MKTIAIAGASGFIGRWMIDKYHHQYKFIAISRNEVIDEKRPNVTWRTADLYSMTSTQAALEGADYALLVTPYYNKPNQKGLIAHYEKIADSSQIKQILYNVPM